MDNHKIISVTETIKTTYMLKNWTITLVKDLQMTSDSEAELAGDQLETASHNKEIRFHWKKKAAKFHMIGDKQVIIFVTEITKMIYMLKSWIITLVKDSQMILDSEAEQAGDQSETVFHNKEIRFYWKAAFHTIGDKLVIIFVTEITKMIFMLKNWIIMPEKDSQMTLDSEAEQVGDQSEAVFHKLQIKLLQETVYHTITHPTEKVITYVTEIDSMIWNQNWAQILMITLSKTMDSELRWTGDILDILNLDRELNTQKTDTLIQLQMEITLMIRKSTGKRIQLKI